MQTLVVEDGGGNGGCSQPKEELVINHLFLATRAVFDSILGEDKLLKLKSVTKLVSTTMHSQGDNGLMVLWPKLAKKGERAMKLRQATIKADLTVTQVREGCWTITGLACNYGGVEMCFLS